VSEEANPIGSISASTLPRVVDSSRPKITLSTRLFFATGGLATGIVNTGFAGFILLYYNLVLGISATLVGTALALALVVDAITDPIIGYASDNLRSRLGRRHPFIYAAIIPVIYFFYMLWHPPLAHLDDTGLFFYLLFMSIAVRLSLTFFEVPSNALVPELTQDYDERTRLLNYRWSFYFFSANGLTVLLYGFWLVDSPDLPNGLLNESGYREMGTTGAYIIALAMIISSLGLHQYIPYLKSNANVFRFSPRKMYKEIYTTFSDISLLALLAAGMFYSSGNGLINSLWPYLYTYFWGLSTRQMSLLTFIYTVGAVVAFLATRALTKSREKKSVAMGIVIGSSLVTPSVVALRLIGWLPENDSDWIFPILLVHGLTEVTLYIMFTIMLASMMSDLVERRQLVTGKRHEAVLYSAQTFIIKITSGLGTWIAGYVLHAVRFPTNAEVVDVPPDTIFNLGATYAPTVLILFGVTIIALIPFRLSRAEHSDNVRRTELPQ